MTAPPTLSADPVPTTREGPSSPSLAVVHRLLAQGLLRARIKRILRSRGESLSLDLPAPESLHGPANHAHPDRRE